MYLGANSTISAIQAIDPGTTFSRNLAIQSQGGNVLIGTLTDSSQKLAVKGSASAPSLTANATAIASFTPSAVGTRLVVGGDSSTPFCVWMQNRHSDIDGLSYPIAINPSGGNVLIGTTTDGGQKLQVNGDGKFSGSVYAEKSGAGFTGQSTGLVTQVTTVNSTTYNVTTGSAKVFVVQLASGDAALCYASYKSSTITILGSDGTIVNSSSPDTGQLGIYKSANNHVISFKTGSNALAGGYASWGFCFLGNPVISIA